MFSLLKRLTIAVFVLFQFLFVPIYGQNAILMQPIDLPNNKLSIKKAIKYLSEQTNLSVSYSESRLFIRKTIFFPSTNLLIKQMLDSMKSQANIDFKLIDRQLVLYRVESKQEFYTIEGFVNDSATGEALIAATVYIPELNIGTYTDQYGFYSFNIPKAQYQLQFSYLGYNFLIVSADLNKNKKYHAQLVMQSINIDEVTIKPQKEEEKLWKPATSRSEINQEQIRGLPAFMGEHDVVRNLSIFPGIQAHEASNGISIRGGTAEQNYFQLDEAPLFATAHLGGLVSVFNPDAIKNLTVYKSDIPSKYGGGLSSVIDVRMKDGNDKQTQFHGGISPIAIRGTVEGPLVKERCSYILSYRRSYLDQILKLIDDSTMHNTDIFFRDVSFKINYRLDDYNRIYFSYYNSGDKLIQTGGLAWFNNLYSLRWHHLFQNNSFLVTSIIYSDSRTELFINDPLLEYAIKSRIQNYLLKTDLKVLKWHDNSLDAGYGLQFQQFLPAELLPAINSGIQKAVLSSNKNVQNYLYSSLNYKLTPKWAFNAGARFTIYNQLGPFDYFRKNDYTSFDTIHYPDNKLVETYGRFEPRVVLSYSINNNNTFKLAYNRTLQLVHQTGNIGLSIPLSRKYPSTKSIESQYSNNFIAGYYKSLSSQNIDFTVESYFKHLYNQYFQYDILEVFTSYNYESLLYKGETKVAGIEAGMQKKSGKHTGSVAWSCSKVLQRVSGYNANDWFHPYSDRRHNISTTYGVQVTRRLSFNTHWLWLSGAPFDVPVGKYMLNNQMLFYYADRKSNAYRSKPYHRLDISADLKSRNYFKKRYKAVWNFSVYNVYNRHNPITTYYKEVVNNEITHLAPFTENTIVSSEPKPVKNWFFGIFPSVSYNFSF